MTKPCLARRKGFSVEARCRNSFLLFVERVNFMAHFFLGGVVVVVGWEPATPLCFTLIGVVVAVGLEPAALPVISLCGWRRGEAKSPPQPLFCGMVDLTPRHLSGPRFKTFWFDWVC